MTRHTDTLRRRPDGPINSAVLAAPGRTRLCEAAHDLGAAVTRKARRPLFGLAALLALRPFPGDQG